MDQTPRELGFSFPPEWARHAATWMSWPRPGGISFPGRYELVVPQVVRLAREIARREPLHVNVPDAAWEQTVRDQMAAHGLPGDVVRNVRFFHFPTDESWCRDHGPAFVARGGELAVVDWKFNAWGGKYPPWDADDRVPARVAEALGLRRFTPEIVMEGGAVDFDGNGTVLTTTDCLLHPSRNGGLTRGQIEQFLLDFYGQRQVCWLTGGIAGDDTDGHVDDLARFVDSRTIVVGVERDPADENHEPTRAAADQCRALRDADGRAYDVVELPMPAPVEIEGQRLPATHVNFHFVNGALLVPTFGGPSDAAALATLQERLPGREVVGVDCSEIIWGLGAIHCLTQQQPAVPVT